MRNKTRFMSGLLILMVMMAASVQSAAATAIGMQPWGGFTVSFNGVPLGIPAGTLTYSIIGSGRYVSSESAGFASVGNLCDASMKFVYGSGSTSFSDPIHYGCSHQLTFPGSSNSTLPHGTDCAQLYADDWKVLITQQCSFIQ